MRRQTAIVLLVVGTLGFSWSACRLRAVGQEIIGPRRQYSALAHDVGSVHRLNRFASRRDARYAAHRQDLSVRPELDAEQLATIHRLFASVSYALLPVFAGLALWALHVLAYGKEGDDVQRELSLLRIIENGALLAVSALLIPPLGRTLFRLSAGLSPSFVHPRVLARSQLPLLTLLAGYGPFVLTVLLLGCGVVLLRNYGWSLRRGCEGTQQDASADLAESPTEQ